MNTHSRCAITSATTIRATARCPRKTRSTPNAARIDGIRAVSANTTTMSDSAISPVTRQNARARLAV
jgi:hypothetical protein